MSITLKLPSLGESVVDGIVSRWLVREGDRVELDQSLCEVTTDKVDAEIPAPVAGRVTRILVSEGTTVEVGAELAMLEPETDVISGDFAVNRGGDVAVIPDGVSAVIPDGVSAPMADAGPTRVRATPVARRLAADAELDLSLVLGTGSTGCITKTDVISHARAQREGASPSAEPRAASGAAATSERPVRVAASPTPPLPRQDIVLEEGDRVVPMSPQRRLIAAHMVYSKQTSPHVGTVAEVDLGTVAELRRRHAEVFRERHGTALTMLPFIAYCAVRALREFPALNASVAADAIIERGGVHLSIAVETEKGLLAPVVRHADRLSLAGLAVAIDDLSTRARDRRLGPDALQGGTFTLSNPGRQGNLYGFAIINQPQVGILRMGELVKRAVVRAIDGQDAIVVRPMMHIALSYDHRAVDGARANAFLFRVRELLEAAAFDL